MSPRGPAGAGRARPAAAKRAETPRVRVGVLGCGKIAQERHLPEYRDNPQAEIAGLFDLNAARAAELAELYGARAYPSAEALLADASIDAVSVCVSNRDHADAVVAALRAGKHVLCEKPMATTLADCERMVAEAKAAGRFLMIDQNQRLAPAHIEARRRVLRGDIGRLLTFRATFGHGGPETWTVDPGHTIWFFDRSRAALGCSADLGVHKIDLIHYLTGDEIVGVSAHLFTLDKKTVDGAPIDVDDNAVFLCRTRGGAVGTVTASWTYYGAEDNSTVLYGTKGELHLYEDPRHTLVYRPRGGEAEAIDAGGIQTNAKQTKSGVIDRFVAGVLNPDAREITGESVLHAMRVLFAGITSSREGREVCIGTREETP